MINTQTIFTDQAPALPDVTDNRSYELGMKFSADTNGVISSIRYWKALSETGAHSGRIWSTNGTLLATVDFTNETASGWQEATLPTPLNITASTVYTVSVNTNSHYVFTLSGLATSLINGNLSSVADNNNGVFGDLGTFPTTSYFNSNYWRDIRFSPTPPVVSQTIFTDQTPALPDVTDNRSYELGMKFFANTNGVISSIRYWKALSETGAHTGRIWSTNGTLLASVDFTNETASGWQEATLPTPLNITASTVYTVSVNTNSHYVFTLSGLATSLINGNLSSVADNNNGVFGDLGTFPTTSYFNSNYWRDIRFSPTPPVVSQTIFTDQTPALPDVTDNRSYELGMKFFANTNGVISSIRYWKALSETGAHTGRIWSTNGTLLASVDFTNETASGWQEATLPTPLNVSANTVYTVSVNTNSHYVFTLSGLGTRLTNGNLSSVADNNNGVFGDLGTFPTTSFFNSNYWRDVRFSPTSTP